MRPPSPRNPTFINTILLGGAPGRKSKLPARQASIKSRYGGKMWKFTLPVLTTLAASFVRTG